jgi:hypothetical protein
MPLVSDGKSKPLPHSNSRSIGIWMSVEGLTPIQAVRVLASYEALSQLVQQTYEICLVLLRISIASGR